jgi:hypothetical protein
VTGDCHQHPDRVGSNKLPSNPVVGVNTNIGLVYYRQSAVMVHCIYNL